MSCPGEGTQDSKEPLSVETEMKDPEYSTVKRLFPKDSPYLPKSRASSTDLAVIKHLPRSFLSRED